MMSYIIDQIPWWVYLLGALMGGSALFYFFSPILIPLWAATPKSVKIALGAVGAALLAFAYGLNKGNRDAKALRDKNNAQALNNRKEIDHEVSNLDEPAVDQRLDKWMRD